MDLVKRLENYRLENKIPQEELAQKLGVAFSTVNRWLNRKSKPNKIQSYHIAKLLKEGSKYGKGKNRKESYEITSALTKGRKL